MRHELTSAPAAPATDAGRTDLWQSPAEPCVPPHGARVLVENMLDPLFAVDRSWRIVYINPPAQLLLGAGGNLSVPGSAGLTGQLLWDVYPSLLGTECEKAFHRAFSERTFSALTTYDRTRNCWYHVRAYPSANGISVRIRLLAEPPKIRPPPGCPGESSPAIQASQHDFLATLGHELRTPLNVILGWAELLLQRAPSNEGLRDGLAIIERNARSQARLLDDLLDVDRIVQGAIRLDRKPLEAKGILERSVASMQAAADVNGVALKAICDASSGKLLGDATRLEQVLETLLSNAINFTPPGGTIVARLSGNDGHITIRITDTGQGIPHDFLPYVFAPFRQADGSTTRRVGGFGLGLTIVKHLVKLHGGSIIASSPGEGQGSTFTLEIPRQQAASTSGTTVALAEDPSPLAGTVLTGLRVLLVEDEADVRELLERILLDCGAEVATARSAAEGLAHLEGATPDVLVSDIGMPETDGYAFIRQVRSLAPPLCAIPALALTAFVRPDDKQRALNAGYHAHVAKPVDAGTLVSALADLAAPPRLRE